MKKKYSKIILSLVSTICLVVLVLTLFSACKPHRHSLVKVDAKFATCTENGNTEHYKCTKCNQLFSDVEATNATSVDIVTILGHHSLERVSEISANCTENGNKGYFKCNECDRLFLDIEAKQETSLAQVVVGSTGHNVQKVEAKVATCYAPGCVEHYKCANCGETYLDGAGLNKISAESVMLDVNPDAHKCEDFIYTAIGLKQGVCSWCNQSIVQVDTQNVVVDFANNNYGASGGSVAPVAVEDGNGIKYTVNSNYAMYSVLKLPKINYLAYSKVEMTVYMPNYRYDQLAGFTLETKTTHLVNTWTASIELTGTMTVIRVNESKCTIRLVIGDANISYDLTDEDVLSGAKSVDLYLGAYGEQYTIFKDFEFTVL